MTKIFFTLATATLLSVCFAAPTFAAPRTVHNTTSRGVVHHNGPGVASVHVSRTNGVNRTNVTIRTSNSNARYANYHVTNGVRFAHGYMYRGRNHYHWTAHRWDARYGCECYWDPYARSWFYFCVPANCYYPVSYVPYQTYVFPMGQVPVVPVNPNPIPVNPNPVVPIDNTQQTDVVPPLPDPVVPQPQ